MSAFCNTLIEGRLTIMAEKLWQYVVQLIIAFSLVKLTKLKIDAIVLGFAPEYFLIVFFVWAVGIVLLSFLLTKVFFIWLQQRKKKQLEVKRREIDNG